MKLSQVRPCDNCGQKIAPIFYVLRISQAMFLQTQTNQILGMAQYFQGALGLAEIMSSDAEAVMIFGEKDPTLMDELFLCQNCQMSELNLAALLEKRNQE